MADHEGEFHTTGDATAAYGRHGECPAQRVLRLPELLPEIFQHLDRRSLAAAVRVNRAWAAAAIPELWRYPTRKALDALPAKRAHAYDAAVRGVELRVMLKRQLKKAWKLPRLQSVTFVYRDVAAEAPLMQAVLQQHAATLTQVAMRPCVGYRAGSVPVANGHRVDSMLGSSHLLGALVACRRLVHLRLDLTLLRSALPDLAARAETTRPFALLRTLRVSVDAPTLPALCRLFSAVQQLTLVVADALAAQNVFGALSGLANLHELSFSSCCVVDGSELRRLACAGQLRVLSVWALGLRFASDDEFASVVSAFPRLCSLTLPTAGGLSDKAYVRVGEHCRQLAYLYLKAGCDVEHFHGPNGSPLFPSLRKLIIDTFTGTSQLHLRRPNNPLAHDSYQLWLMVTGAKSDVKGFRTAYAIAELFCQEAPVLRRVVFSSPNDMLDIYVSIALGDLRRANRKTEVSAPADRRPGKQRKTTH